MQHGDIIRAPGANPHRSQAVAYGGFAWAVATSRNKKPTLREQTADALDLLDDALREVGADRTRLLTATVYITDITQKAEMDAAWNAWMPAGCGPQRACVQAALAPGELVEIVVMAAMS